MMERATKAREHQTTPKTRRWRGYDVAVAGTMVAALVRWGLGWVVEGDLPPYITFYPVVLAAAVAGGTGPGVVATILSALAVDMLLLEPIGSLGPATVAEAVGMGLFTAINLAISIVGGRLSIKSEALRESEARLRMSHQAAHIGTFEWNVQTGVNTWTPELESMYGLKPGEFGRTQPAWEQLVHPEDRAKAVGTVERALKTFQPEEGEWRAVWPDGTVRWLVGRFQVFRDHAGKPLRLVGANVDITDRKEAEEALHQSEERFRTMVDAIPQLAWIARPDGHIFWYNRRCYEYTGATSDQLEGWGWQGVADPQVLPRALEQWRRSIATGQPLDLELPLRGADGRFRPFLTRVMPLKDNEGRVTLWFGTNTDIAEQKQAQEELWRLKEDLEVRVEQRTAELSAVNRELNDFASIVAHDLKAPLRGVAMIAEWLQKDHADELNAKGRERLIQMSKRVARMDRMIDDILEYTRLGRTEEKPEPVALAKLVRVVVQDLAPPAHVHIHLAPGLPVVQGEPVRLRQVFQNLIGNAIKYADKFQVEIRVDWAEVDSMWEFCVADNGPGIEAEHFERIFKMFQTLAPKDRTDSTGVGLALVKRIVERAGGRVWVESRLGEGSRFHFTWPKGPWATTERIAG